MIIKENPDKELVDDIKKQLSQNGGYCPCMVEKNEDTKCMCKEFREDPTKMECHCGRFIRE